MTFYRTCMPPFWQLFFWRRGAIELVTKLSHDHDVHVQSRMFEFQVLNQACR